MAGCSHVASARPGAGGSCPAPSAEVRVRHTPPQPARWGCSSPGGLAVLGCCCRSTPSVGSPQVSWGRGTGVERRLGRAVGAGVDQPHGRVPSAAGAGETRAAATSGFRVRPRRGRPCGRGRGHRGDGACLEEGALKAGGRGLRSEPCWAARGGRWPWPWQRRRQEEKPQRGGLGGARPRPPGPSPRAWEAMKLRNGRDRARRDHRGSAVGGGGAAALQSLAGCFWPLMCPGASLVGLCFPPLMAFGPWGTPGPRLGHSPGDTRE